MMFEQLTTQTHYMEHWQCDRQHAVTKVTPVEGWGSNGSRNWVWPCAGGSMDLLTMEMKVLSSGILIKNCENLTSCKEVGISLEGPSMYPTHTDWLILVRKSYVYNWNMELFKDVLTLSVDLHDTEEFVVFSNYLFQSGNGVSTNHNYTCYIIFYNISGHFAITSQN